MNIQAGSSLPKIAFVVESYYPAIGGAERVLTDLCTGLAKLGYDVSVITVQLRGVPPYEIVDSVKVFRYVNRLHRYLLVTALLPGILNIVKRADIIHTTTFVSSIPGFLAKVLHHKPCVITVWEILRDVYDQIFGWPSSKLYRLAEQQIARLGFDVEVAISRYTYRRLMSLGVPEDRVRLVYPGINHQIFHPMEKDESLVRSLGLEGKRCYLFSGRFSKLKGLSCLIRAANFVRSEFKDSKLIVIGVPAHRAVDESAIVYDLVRRLNLQKHVCFMQVPGYDTQLLAKCKNLGDVLVAPSLSEGFSMSIMEANALGKPTVATNVGSIPEVVLDGRTGLLVEPMNPRALADAILYFLENEDEARRFGRRAYEYSQKFRCDEMVSRYERIYQEIL